MSLDLNELIEQVKGMTDLYAESLDPDGDWLPMLFLAKENKLALIGLAGNFMADKDKFANEILPNIIHQIGEEPEAIVFLVSSWMVKLDKNADPYETPPSEHPDRIEAIVLFGVSKDEEFGVIGEIIRRDSESPHLDWESISDNKMSDAIWSGRMIAGLRRGIWG